LNEVILAFLASPEVQASISTILLTVITGLVTVASRTIFGWLKANTSTKQFELLQEIAAVAVRASEQGAIGGFVTDRKATAINIVNEQLKAAGVKNISAEQIEAAIEAAVIAAATEFTDAAVARATVNVVPEVREEAEPADSPSEDNLPGDGADTV
jgi:LL-H family phage holin